MRIRKGFSTLTLVIIIFIFNVSLTEKAHCWSSKKIVTWQNIGFRFTCYNPGSSILHYELHQYTFDYTYGYFRFAKYTGTFQTNEIKILNIAAVPLIGRYIMFDNDMIAFTLKIYNEINGIKQKHPCHVHNIFQTDLDHGHNNAVLGFRGICCI